MRRELRLSLLILVLVVSSIFFLGVIGFSSEIWTHVALSGAKKVGTKIVLRVIYHSDLLDLPLGHFPFLERFLNPGI